MDTISKCVDTNIPKLLKILNIEDEVNKFNNFDNYGNDMNHDTNDNKPSRSNIFGNTDNMINYRIVALLKNEKKETEIINDIDFNDGEMIDPLDTSVCIKEIHFSKTVIFESKTRPVKIPYITYDGTIKAMIFKKEDVRQDQIAINIIKYIRYILEEKGINIDIVTYQILPFSKDYGLIEMATNCNTVENIQKTSGNIYKYLMKNNGGKVIDETIMDTFISTAAAYCVITYILGVGDRHLGNIMMTNDGKLFNIDFGYIFGRDPKTRLIESGIRFTDGMINFIGGRDGENYKKLERQCLEIFFICRKEVVIIWRLLSMLTNIPGSNVTQEIINNFIQSRFLPNESENEAQKYFINMLEKSESFSQTLSDAFHTCGSETPKTVEEIKKTLMCNVGYLGDKIHSFIFSGSN